MTISVDQLNPKYLKAVQASFLAHASLFSPKTNLEELAKRVTPFIVLTFLSIKFSAQLSSDDLRKRKLSFEIIPKMNNEASGMDWKNPSAIDPSAADPLIMKLSEAIPPLLDQDLKGMYHATADTDADEERKTA
jgi:hypothetical protein